MFAFLIIVGMLIFCLRRKATHKFIAVPLCIMLLIIIEYVHRITLDHLLLYRITYWIEVILYVSLGFISVKSFKRNA